MKRFFLDKTNLIKMKKMKKNKLLIGLILLVFLTFGLGYSKFINHSIIVKTVIKPSKIEKIADKIVIVKKKPFLTRKASTVTIGGVTITNAVAINGGGNAVPGSQLNFTFTVENTTGSDATGTTFEDILDSNLTLVSNSLKATPIATNDSYNCIGNVGITVNAAGGVLNNDVSPDATTITATVLANPTNGTVTLATNGSFTYKSNVGYSGTDTFTYTLTSTNGKTNTATVSIIVSSPIYFVNSSTPTNGNGTLFSPFKTVDNVTGVTAGSIFIYSGASGTSLTLADNVKVIGQGATASLATIVGITTPTYSYTLPSTGGTNPTFSVLNLKLNNDVEGITLSGTSATMTGTNVGALKVRDVTISGGTAIAVNIAAGGVLDCIFKSISADGASKGISINNATGSFQVTGTGTTNGSGGIIQNITNRGAEFISCTNVTLKNMNFINSSTSTSLCSTPATDNSSCNGAIHLKTVTGVALDNISITGTTNAMGININNVSAFSLSNSSITGCGSANGGNSNVGGIYALNLSGTSTITNSNVNDSWGRGFYCNNGILSVNPTLNMTITGSQFKNSFNKSNGDSNFIFKGSGSSNTSLVLKNNDFSNPKTDGITLIFGGTSTNTIQVGGNALADGNKINPAALTPGNNGLQLLATSAAVVNYNILNNTFKSSFNGSFPCNIGNQGSGTMKGRVNFNTIDGGSAGSSSNGISVAAYGNGNHITEIKGNTITNITNYGIVSEANDNNTIGSARMDATIKDNNISLLAYGYAHVGVIAVGSDNASTLKSVANIGNNTTNSPVNNLATGAFDVLAFGTNSQVILQGSTAYVSGSGNRSAALTSYWNANNVGTRTALDEIGGGTILSGTALTPDNASALKLAIPLKVTPEIAMQVSEIAVVPTGTKENTKSTAKQKANTITVGPFTLPTGKNTIITFSATINAAINLPANTCEVTNKGKVSGSNFTTVNSNITTTSIKPATATFTNSTENIACLGSTTVNLNATCPLGTTATWYTSLTGGTSFATGGSITATPTANNTTYCVACEVVYCASDRLLVKTVTGTESTVSSQTVSACENYTWTANGVTYTTSGTYTKVTGCDTKTLNLTITKLSTIDVTVDKNSAVLTANQAGATYQWYKCPNTLLINETNQSYTALAIGDYKVDVTMGACTKTSTCVTVSSTLATSEFKQNEFKIYPNPSSGIINISSPIEGNYSIIDITGKILKSFNLNENIETILNLEYLSDGTYYVKCNTNNSLKTKIILIKK